MKCCVCQLEAPQGEMLQNSLTGNKQFYCLACLTAGYEPYQDLVDFGWEFEMFNKPYQQRIILPTLNRQNKTIQQFNEDVRNKLKENE